MLCMTGATLFLRRGARFAHFSRMGARPSHMAGVAVQGHVLDTVVGRGAFATVFAARTPAGDRVALKLFPAAGTTAAAREVAVLQRLRAANTPCTCHMLDAGDLNGRPYITFRLRGCSAYELLVQRKSGGLPPDVLQTVTHAVVTALAALHTLGLAHADVKPENVLLAADRASAWLADFGLSQDSPFGHVTYAQSRFYRAPEVVLGAGATTLVDVWSLGCMTWELATGRVLFRARDEGELYARHKALPLPPDLVSRSTRGDAFLARPALGRSVVPTGDDDVAQFVRGCLVADPRRRPAIAQLLGHACARRPGAHVAI